MSAVMLTLCVCIAGCGEDETDELVRVVPGISRDLARHLSSSDDETLSAFGLELGFHNLLASFVTMNRAFAVASDDEAVHVDQIVAPRIARVPVAFAAYPYAVHVRDLVDEWQSLSPAGKRRVARTAARFGAVRNAADSPAKEKDLLELLEQYRAYPRLLDNGEIFAALIALLERTGRTDEVPPLLSRAIAEAVTDSHHASACFLIGFQMALAMGSGDEAALDEAYYRGLGIARHCRPDQEARFLGLMGVHYAQVGRFTMAHELLRAAEEVSRQPGGQGNEIRYFFNLLAMHADLGCWDVIERDLQQQAVLERRAQKYLAGDVATWSRRIGAIRIRHQGAVGNLEQARREFLAAREGAEATPAGDVERLLLTWSDVLIAAGRYDEARPVVMEGIERCLRSHFTDLSLFYLNLARIENGVDQGEACRTALDEFTRHGATSIVRDRHRIQHDVLRARLALAAGDAGAYSQWIGRALTRARQILEKTEASPQGYLGAGVADLRGFLRTCVADDPAAGFALELYWCRATETLGGARRIAGDQHPLTICGDIAGAGGDGTWRVRLARHLDRLDRLEATHCAYAVWDHGVVRWTARNGAIECDELAVTPAQLTDLVTRARAELFAPGDDNGSSLRELSALLLPPAIAVGSAGRRQLLLVSADGPLADLPFEALPMPGDTDEPLIRRVDVAYARGMPDAAGPRPDRPGLVVADPMAAPVLQRRYAGLRGSLGHGLEEAARLVRADSSAVFLSREQATEQAVLARWSDARYLYFATHVLRDPELPYLSFIPMSPAPGNERHESYLVDVSDIRGADLSRCELVVLSGCSSGSGYQDHRARGPALADAFLDAGCGAVVQTFWDVADRDASRFMTDFVGAWAADGVPPLRALNEVRRRWLDAGAEPAVWAGYAIVLNRL